MTARRVGDPTDALYRRFAEALRTKEGATRLVVLDGEPLLEAALEAAADPGAAVTIRGVLWNGAVFGEPHVQGLQKVLEQRQTPVAVVAPERLARLGVSRAVPSALLLVEKRVEDGVSTEDLLRQGAQRVLLVDSVEDPMNVGVILRTAEAFGSTVLAAGSTAPFLSRRVVRSSTGSALRVPLYRSDQDPSRLIDGWRAGGGLAVATSAHGHAALAEVAWRLPHLIVVGNESHGLAPSTRAAAEWDVRIPMAGRAHSLNVTVATGILLQTALAATS